MYTQFKGRNGSRPAQRKTPNKEAKMEKTYWYGNGKFQKDYDDIWERLIPGSGPALTHAGEVFRAMVRLYYRWFNDGDRIQQEMDRWSLAGSATKAFKYLYQFEDPFSEFSTQDFMIELLEASSDKEYEIALEKALDAIVEWTAKQPARSNPDDYLDEKYSNAYTFDEISEEECDW